MAYFGGKKSTVSPQFDGRLLALLVFFLGFGLFTLINLANLKVETQAVATTPVTVSGELQPVIVAKHTIEPGTSLEPSMFRVELRSVQGIEQSVVGDLTPLQGGYSNSIIVEGTPLLKQHISRSAKDGGLTNLIPKGHRAVTIPVDAESGVEGWVRPGVVVDVVWVTNHLGKLLVSTIVENARVLSAERIAIRRRPKDARKDYDNEESPEKMMPTHVTLLLPLRDAQRLQLAKKSEGSLSLSLKGDTDSSESGSETLTIDNLLRPSDLQALSQIAGIKIGKKDFVFKGGALKPSKDKANELSQEE